MGAVVALAHVTHLRRLASRRNRAQLTIRATSMACNNTFGSLEYSSGVVATQDQGRRRALR